MPTSDKLETDYQGFIKKIEQTSSAELGKIRLDFNELRNQAAKHTGVT